jgi:anti-sigma factor RsiW
MTPGCDDVLAARFLDETDGAVEAHVATCAHCATEREGVASVRALLAAATVPAPPPGLSAAVCRAARPLLATNTRRASRILVARALAVALLVLPVVLLADLRVGSLVYEALTALLPRALGLYVVSSWAVTVTGLLALTYAAIPIFAERQAAALSRTTHG